MFNDPHAVYVISAYASTTLILAVIIWATLSTNARTRKELEDDK